MTEKQFITFYSPMFILDDFDFSISELLATQFIIYVLELEGLV
jgi:hypothetical protein